MLIKNIHVCLDDRKWTWGEGFEIFFAFLFLYPEMRDADVWFSWSMVMQIVLIVTTIGRISYK